ncbi:hypothetical protein GCM10016455_16830 [Aliiroseovarius zhejiangensis]|uniref:Uncharacterized protein n=1 Tax=Aliiroseovarius zhejiangensis TaxID=1632025 RepID=A0ABQ3IYG3_9RHOB|nr:hypothetical protein [Aliiroseovarius zhejiangensis]GHE97022.1 hypothetical protein GCM10016455_16830 [Aliiroseovarius zhejiangensis]
MKKLLYLLLLVPLSACFDADLDFVVHDDETATMSAHMLLGPEMYGMIAQSGQDPCEEGVGTTNADGTFSCRVEETDTIDNLIAEIENGQKNAAQGGVNPNQGVSLERMEGPFVRLVFDLAELKKVAAESGADPSMMGMLQQSFQGHRIHMTITGKDIVETNGQLSADGRTAEITIPLRALIEPDASLPDQFVTVVRTE